MTTYASRMAAGLCRDSDRKFNRRNELINTISKKGTDVVFNETVKQLRIDLDNDFDKSLETLAHTANITNSVGPWILPKQVKETTIGSMIEKAKFNTNWDRSYELGAIKDIEEIADNYDFNKYFFNRMHDILPTLTDSEKADSELGLELVSTIAYDWKNKEFK